MHNRYAEWPHDKLPTVGSWSAVKHQYDEEAAYALLAAEGTGRPLLVQGEPGSGKSQLARYAAAVNKRRLISTVITASTEADDLRWRCDNLARLSEAQLAALAEDRETAQQNIALGRFITPGALWWAFNYESASKQFDENCEFPLDQPPPEQNLPDEAGVVLLIDEIDKADSDLPNSLLDVLGNGDFHVPLMKESIRQSTTGKRPLVIITSNNERELPAAFKRRCVVLNLNLPEEPSAFEALLVERGECHHGNAVSLEVRQQAAKMLYAERKSAKDAGEPHAGQAEYLDMLQALVELTASAPDREQAQQALLHKIQPYIFSKGTPAA